MNNKRYICPACHTNQELADGYCNNCGTRLEMVRYCNSCGVEAASRSKFCRECGELLPAVTKAHPAVAPPRAEPPQPLNSPQPVWLNKPAAEPKATWMNEPVQAAAPAPNISPIIPQAAPLTSRPQAAPVPMSAATQDSARQINTTHLAIASVLALLALLSLLKGNIIFAIIAFIIMLNVVGASLAHMIAEAFNKIIDWMWESPVMRRRFLGE